MSGPSLLAPEYNRRDSDEPWMHWPTCAACQERREYVNDRDLCGECEPLFCSECGDPKGAHQDFCSHECRNAVRTRIWARVKEGMR